jgi:hypothetical protein
MHYIRLKNYIIFLLQFNATLKGVIDNVLCFIIQCKPRPWQSYKGITGCKALLKAVLGNTFL